MDNGIKRLVYRNSISGMEKKKMNAIGEIDSDTLQLRNTGTRIMSELIAEKAAKRTESLRNYLKN